METHDSRKSKLTERVRKGRPICVQGYLREYRKEGDTSPYRAIVQTTSRLEKIVTKEAEKQRQALQKDTQKSTQSQTTDDCEPVGLTD